jgi:hypothetical protein
MIDRLSDADGVETWRLLHAGPKQEGKPLELEERSGKALT